MSGSKSKFFGGAKALKKIELPGSILKSNKISILTLDERWNTLFKGIEKTSAILHCEEKINNYIKEQAKLTAELKDSKLEKKALLHRIIEETTEAFGSDSDGDNGDGALVGAALRQIEECKARVEDINAKQPVISDRLSVIQNELMNANMELLENAAAYLYQNINRMNKRITELDHLIEESRKALGDYVEERDEISVMYSEVYAHFHDLLGADQISELDRIYGTEI
jgi:hypothetical protein